LSNVNSKAVGSAKSWAQLSAAFSGFHALTRVVRGGKEDRWNGIVGAAMTGAFLNRQGGPQAMVQGASMYASFSYVLDVFFGTKGSKVGPDGTLIDDQFQYTEQELN
jgi:import inner membrane translocase subunit TIM22